METKSKLSIQNFNLCSYLWILTGIAFMVVGGIFLIQGLNQIFNNPIHTYTNIVLAFLLQILESACFMLAASVAVRSNAYRMGASVFGLILFVFSVVMMSLVQKAMLQANISQANLVDDQVAYLEKKIKSLDQNIDVLRFNSKKQSESIYGKNRRLAVETMNEVSTLEREKDELAKQLFFLSSGNKQSVDGFFSVLKKYWGISVETTVFWFSVLRAILIELGGMFSLAVGAYLRSTRSGYYVSIPAKVDNASKFNQVLNQAPTTIKTETTNQDITDETLLVHVLKLFNEHGIISGRDALKKALKQHYGIGIGSTRAKRILEMLNVDTARLN